jgi:hypothetical protein
MIGSMVMYLTIVIAIVVSSCSNQAVDVQPKTSNGIDLGQYRISVVDTIQALLLYHVGDWVEDGSIGINSNVQAFTFESDTMVDVSSVTVNGSALQRRTKGIYAQEVPSVPSGTTTALAWDINGYLGGNFSNTFNMAPRMTLTNLSFGDTISASTGKTITYSGALSGSNLEVDVALDYASSEYWIHPDSTTGSGVRSKVIPDAGTIVLSPADLSGLTPHRVYNLLFRHGVYSSVPYGGTKVGHYSVYSVDIPFVLVP